MSSLLPPKTARPLRKRSVFMEDELWDGMEEIAQSTRGDPHGEYDRQEVIRHACRRLLDEWRAEKEGGKKPRR